MIKTTKAQRAALKCKFDQSKARNIAYARKDGYNIEIRVCYINYRHMRKEAVQGDYGSLMILWCNMWLGIESDGYTHS